jgi:hypothetical protein
MGFCSTAVAVCVACSFIAMLYENEAKSWETLASPLWFYCDFTSLHHHSTCKFGVRGGAVGSGTRLLAGRSRFRFTMGSVGFFSDLILSAALWTLDRLSL